MTLEELSISALAEKIGTRGFQCKSPDGVVLPLPALALEFLAHEARAQAQATGQALSVVFEARAAGAATDGIRILSIGFGPSVETAAQDAAEQWAMGVFPVLVSYMLKSKHVCEVEKSPMIVAVQDSDERYGWTVHLGPVIARLYGRPGEGATGPIGELSSSEIYRAIFDVLH